MWNLGWRRAAIALSSSVVVTAVVAAGCSAEPPQGGAANPDDAVSAYVTALNASDPSALRELGAVKNQALDDGIDDRLARYGRRDLHLTSREVRVGDVVPHQATAVLNGTLNASAPYEERLFLTQVDGRWYIHLQKDPSSSVAPPLPPAGTERPK
jgi:hypothetical protein